jgi:hypothetical protein
MYQSRNSREKFFPNDNSRGLGFSHRPRPAPMKHVLLRFSYSLTPDEAGRNWHHHAGTDQKRFSPARSKKLNVTHNQLRMAVVEKRREAARRRDTELEGMACKLIIGVLVLH